MNSLKSEETLIRAGSRVMRVDMHLLVWAIVGGLALIPVAPFAAHSSVVLISLFAILLGLGWIVATGLLTWFCNGDGLAVEVPRLSKECHALCPIRLGLRLVNVRSRRPAWFLTVWFDADIASKPLPAPAQFVAAASAGSDTELEWEITVRARGAIRISRIRVVTRFPGGLFRFEYEFPVATEVVVLPAELAIDRKLLAVLTGRRHTGTRVAQNANAMDEFVGVREYRAGDNPRLIHLPTSIRMSQFPQQLVVREYEDFADDDLCIILDTAVSSDRAGAEELKAIYRFERTLAFSIAACRLFVGTGYRVRFRALGATGLSINLLFERAEREVRKLERALASLRPIVDRRPVWRMIEEETRRSNATVLFLSARDVEDPRIMALPALSLPSDWQAGFIRKVKEAA